MSPEIRPVRTPEQERQMMLGWVRDIRSEVGHNHRAQGKLSKLEFHLSQPPFPVRGLDLAPEPLRDRSASALVWAAIGSALFAAAGAALPSVSWATTFALIGALALTIAFDRSDAA